MKKFLSLVLAVIMTMSLVTISASAAEYKDFTDRDEIQYEEAVAVLNRLGIITGYSEGDFRPEGELTRGAAAKIIASLLIGPEAANNLTPTTAPFKDVPLDHTFAGPIAYCSTLKIINGYSDGSFQPGGTLTGYAFSKMLLGALGYDGDLEGFTGAGWNMNVMRLGGEAGLFDRISFKGNEAVNREQAAQLALNTLKGTLVEYTGGLNVTAGDASVTSKPQRNYKTSNQEFAAHINNKKAGGQLGTAANALYTVEFGEEHFVDLRMTHDRNTYDDFGRPSHEWSSKKVTIGTFPIEADKVYTEQVAHDVATVTNASKARSLGLTGFEVVADRDHGATSVTVNGKPEDTGILKDVGEIADYTDNGTIVEVYVDEDNADWVKDVVVIKTQLMEVKRLGKDSVSLDLYDNGSAHKGKTPVMGFNQAPIDVKVDNVEVDDAFYTLLSGLKVGDLVAVVPVTTDDGSSYTVAKAYVPETVSGKLNKVSTYGTGSTVGTDVNTINVTVGDTAYDVALWNKDLTDVDGTKLDVTTKDVTLTLDEFGNAMLAEDVGATSDFMVVGSYYQSLVNGKLVNYVKGWDISGEELTLNIGSKERNRNIEPGDLVHYTNATTGDADWKINDTPAEGVFDVRLGKDPEIGDGTTTNYSIKSSNTRILLEQAYKGADKGTSNPVTGSNVDNYKPWVDKSIKFIYVTFNDDGDVDSIEIKNGVQAASYDELSKKWSGSGNTNYDEAQAALKLKNDAVTDDSTVKAVVIKNESNDALASNMLYIVNYKGGAGNTANGDIVYEYTVAMNGTNGLVDDEMTIYSTKKLNRGDWARYTEVKNDDYENFYALSGVNQRGRATSTMDAFFDSTKADGGFIKGNHSLVYLDKNKVYAPNGSIKLDDNNVDPNLKAPSIKDARKTDLGTGDNNAAFLVSLRYATWVDLTGNGIDSYDDLYDLTHGDTKEYDLKNVKVSMIFNDDPSKDNFRQVAMIVVQSTGATSNGSNGSENSGTEVSWKARLNSRGEPIVDFVVTRPSWAADDATGTVKGDLYIDGVKTDWTTGSDTIGTASGNSSTVSGRGENTADSADDVSIRNLTVTWDKVVVKAEDAEALPAGVTIATSIAKGATKINVTIPATVSTRAAGDVTGAKITVKEGTTVLANKTDLTTGENEVTLSPAVSGTAAVTVKVELTVDQAPVAGQTVTVTAPDGWTATGSPYTVPSSGAKKVTVTLTSNTKGELSPAKTLTVTPAAGWTAGAVSFTNGTGNASTGTAATFTFDVTVTGEENVTIAKTAFAVADAGVVVNKHTLSTTATMSNWTKGGTADGQVAENTPVSITFTQSAGKEAPVAGLSEGAIDSAKYEATGLPAGATVTLTKQGVTGVAAVDAAYTDIDLTSISWDNSGDGTSITDTDITAIMALVNVSASVEKTTLYEKTGSGSTTTYTAVTLSAGDNLSGRTFAYKNTAAVSAVTAVPAVITITFDMPAEDVAFSAFALV